MDKRVRVQAIHYNATRIRSASLHKYNGSNDPNTRFFIIDMAPLQSVEDLLVPKPISFGIRAPHCTTFQTDCSSEIQNATIARMMMRVRRGRRKMYERSRAG